GEDFYRIANYDRMRPFFMTVVSDADHWMFISSNGGLTAGRRNADLALFPYYTDDKLRDMAEVTGSKTIVTVRQQNRESLWEPFSIRGQGIYHVRRNLFKNFFGNKLIFEEINEDLALTFRYGWFNSNKFGFVRRAWLTNSSRSQARIEILDGLQNLMPCGTGSQFNLEYSTLLDAYKRSELLKETGLGLFRLSAIPVDRPEPAEALRTTTVWSLGLKAQNSLLSSAQLDRFRQRLPLDTENDVRGERGAYFVQSAFSLAPGQTVDWLIVADVGQSASDVVEINQLLKKPAQVRKSLLADVEHGTRELERIVAAADGLQRSANPLSDARHSSNTLFNVMRGGIFHDGYKVDSRDLQSFVANANKDVAARRLSFFRGLAKPVLYTEMVSGAVRTGDPQLERLCREYLPLTFSRRHGDPSRPWNRFWIATRSADGTRNLNYEGNWRDIFQNWEGLAVSFPGYVSGMICRFVNASTADGYNPYRITRNGIDWEIVDPHDPWSYIGYWGDHQIIYLLKLLEILERHDPRTLQNFLTREIFAYANVPYRIKPHEALIANSKDTVIFDQELHCLIQERTKAKGADGKLATDRRGKVRLVNLTEKLLVPILAKLSNFIPGAGIWLNTQRPEWNDANNALVGNGASMVTLYYLRRHFIFCRELFRSQSETRFAISSEVLGFLNSIGRVLEKHRRLLSKGINDRDRRRVLDDLGRAGSAYRERIYRDGFSGRKQFFARERLIRFFEVALEWINHSISSNRREDGLYHSYNLVRFESKTAVIRRLYPMLEGQVAVLSSGCLVAEESLEVLRALKRSAMFRPDQHSFVLYPNRELPRFLERNNMPRKEIERSALLRKLLADGNGHLVERDVAGTVHFNGTLSNARDVQNILDQLSVSGYARLVQRDAALVISIFEKLFDHESFTGRSGTFFGYEGLGSIYWHMVSKLLLAAQEAFLRARDAGASKRVLKGLADCYYDIRAGIGDKKSAENYGAFPMDPYSHTPAHGGARQPGLTGQVKEDFLCRMGELGVFVKRGEIHFEPALLRREEFVKEMTEFKYYDVAGLERRVNLKPGSLAFTYCQVPVVYRAGVQNGLRVFLKDGRSFDSKEARLDAKTSGSIFSREGKVQRVEVSL
ncbi:MAG TPA: hypothetical protein VFA77_14825, partial [Candidatus Eisenbacteria bacterium]|nr:hypothetical protein [Candidatus Eisenbacteria bacterium]